MSGLRQAALVLHGLADADRAWMLSQLAPEQAVQVGALLAELRELGLPNDPSFATQALGAEQLAAMRVQPPAAPQGPAEAVRAAAPDRMLRVLEGECPGFVAILLASDDWPWRAAFFASLSPARMRAVQDAVRGSESGARLRSQVIAAVARRLRDAGVASPPRTLAPARWQGFRTLVASLRRRGSRA